MPKLEIAGTDYGTVDKIQFAYDDGVIITPVVDGGVATLTIEVDAAALATEVTAEFATQTELDAKLAHTPAAGTVLTAATTGAGLKIGAASTALLGFYGATAVDQPATVTDAPVDASVAHALNATFSDTEAEAALDALGGKVNSVAAQVNLVIDRLIEVGLIAAA